MENRHTLEQNTAEKGTSELNHRLDFQTILERKLFYNKTVGLGGLYRISNQGNRYRFIQQFGLIYGSVKGYKFSHRFRFDQTFENEEEVELRLRYRLGFQYPFVGFRLDEGETYLSSTVEILQKYQEGYTTELRATFSLGLLIPGGNKSEIGLDFRHDNAFAADKVFQYWLRGAFYF